MAVPGPGSRRLAQKRGDERTRSEEGRGGGEGRLAEGGGPGQSRGGWEAGVGPGLEVPVGHPWGVLCKVLITEWQAGPKWGRGFRGHRPGNGKLKSGEWMRVLKA